MASNRIKRNASFSSYVAGINKDVKAIQAQANNITGVADGAITGSSLSGTTELGTNTIQSSNYAEGLTGWKIDGTGVAEFSDVFVRGDINAYSGTIGYWNISNPGVERHVGSKRLFGTFIESENLGDTDIGDDTGVYVGLYRSYREPSIIISGAYRKDDTAIIVSPNHGYKNGDKVSISLTGSASYETRTYTVVNKELTDNTAIITTSEIHDFRSGDTIVIAGVDDTFNGTYTAIDTSSSLKTIDYTIRFSKVAESVSSTAVSDPAALVKRTVSETGFSFSTGPAYVLITEADHSSFRYENTGQNIDFQNSGNFTGTALIYDENVAGLYLNDYSKALFDHGYFSNEGINYVSAQIYNLIHNPSFEYLNDDQAETASTAGWEADDGVAIHDIDILAEYATKSTYGMDVHWNSNVYTDKYVSGTVNYSLMEPSIKYGRVLYFNFDVYANPVGSKITTTAYTLASDASSITVDATAHGLKTGDYVFSSSTTGGYSGHLIEYKNLKEELDENKYRRIVKVVSTTADTFTVNVFGRAVGDTLSNSGQVLYKINIPEFDLTDIKLKFPNGQTVSMMDIVDDSTKATWATSANTKKFTYSPDEIDGRLTLDGETAVLDATLPNMSVIQTGTMKNGKSLEYYRVPYSIKISTAKIYQKYKDTDPTGLAAKSAFKILFPGWLKNTVGDSSAARYFMDSVLLGTQYKFFYGGSKYGSQSWYDSTAKPNTPSIQAPKTWLDIDLEAQTSKISHVDNISFSAPGFSGSLMSYPGISNDNTIDPAAILYGYNDDDATGTIFGSGQYQRVLYTYPLGVATPAKLVSAPLETALIMYESDLVVSTSGFSTYTQLSSRAQYSSNDTGKIASTYSSSIGLYSDENTSEITVSGDYLYFTNTNSWDMAEGTRNPLIVSFDGQVDFIAKSYSNYFEIDNISRTAPGVGETTSTWTVTLTTAVTDATVLKDLTYVDIYFTSLAALDGTYAVTDITGSTTQFTIETDNVALALLTEPLLDSDTSSSGGYIDAFSDSHPTITASMLTPAESSGKIATTEWVQAKLSNFTSTGAGAYKHMFVDAATLAAITADYLNGTSGIGATLTNTVNGTFTVDGYTLAGGDVVLVKDQADDIQNGVYTVEVAGDESTKAVLKRSVDYDNSTNGLIHKGDLIYVGDSSVTLRGRAYINDTVASPIVVGTDAITFAAFGGGSGGGTYTAEAPLDISTENVITMTTGYVWNTDLTAFAKLWVGAATPGTAANGDVWIQVP